MGYMDCSCFICASNVVYWAYGECNHPICHTCMFRLRLLYNTNACPLCKTILNNIAVITYVPTASIPQFSTLMENHSFKTQNFHDGVLYETNAIKANIKSKLLRLNCPFKGCKEESFKSKNEMRKHVNNSHRLMICDVCLEHKKVFSSELKLYTQSSLSKHFKSDGDRDFPGGHPNCEFCKTPFYTNDDLYHHCRLSHEQCHLCEKLGKRFLFFKNYAELEGHFGEEHYLCRENQCLESKFVVFGTEIEYKKHYNDIHMNQSSVSKLQRAAQNRLRSIETGFTIVGPSTSNALEVNQGSRNAPELNQVTSLHVSPQEQSFISRESQQSTIVESLNEILSEFSLAEHNSKKLESIKNAMQNLFIKKAASHSSHWKTSNASEILTKKQIENVAASIQMFDNSALSAVQCLQYIQSIIGTPLLLRFGSRLADALFEEGLPKKIDFIKAFNDFKISLKETTAENPRSKILVLKPPVGKSTQSLLLNNRNTSNYFSGFARNVKASSSISLNQGTALYSNDFYADANEDFPQLGVSARKATITNIISGNSNASTNSTIPSMNSSSIRTQKSCDFPPLSSAIVPGVKSGSLVVKSFKDAAIGQHSVVSRKIATIPQGGPHNLPRKNSDDFPSLLPDTQSSIPLVTKQNTFEDIGTDDSFIVGSFQPIPQGSNKGTTGIPIENEKIKVLSHSSLEVSRQRSNDLHPLRVNPDPVLHPFERDREYARALNSAKLERLFSKPFVGSLDGHTDGVYCLAKDHFSMDRVLSGSANGELKLWNIADKKCTWSSSRAHDSWVRGICFVPDVTTSKCRFLSCSDDKLVKLWSFNDDSKDGYQPVRTFTSKFGLSSVDHHRLNPVFATTDSSGSLSLWHHERNDPISTYTWGHDSLTSVSFNQAEPSLFSAAGTDRSILLYDSRIATNTPLKKVILSMRTNTISWNPQEPFIFASANEDHNIYLFDMRKLTHAFNVMKGHVSAVMDVDWSPTGEELVSASYDRSIRLFKAQTGHSRDIYHTKRMQRVYSVKFTMDSKYILSGSDEGSIRIWKTDAAEVAGVKPARQQSSLDYSNKLKERFSNLPEVRKVLRHRNIPKEIVTASKTKHLMTQSRARKERNERKYKKKSESKQKDFYASEREKSIVTVVD